MDAQYPNPAPGARSFRMRRHRNGIWLPILIIGIGVVFLLDQYNIFPADRAFDFFWPAVLLVAGAESILHGRGGRFPLFGVGLVTVGGALALRNLGYLPFQVENLWPLLLIALGVSMLQRRGGFCHVAWPGSVGSGPGSGVAPDGSGNDSSFDCMAFFGGVKRRVTARDFTGGRLTALFGGFEVDLTHAEIAGDQAVIEANAVFGGGEIRVPEHWLIDVQGQAILGGYSDETHQLPQAAAGAKRLILQGTATFGGVVIKN